MELFTLDKPVRMRFDYVSGYYQPDLPKRWCGPAALDTSAEPLSSQFCHLLRTRAVVFAPLVSSAVCIGNLCQLFRAVEGRNRQFVHADRNLCRGPAHRMHGMQWRVDSIEACSTPSDVFLSLGEFRWCIRRRFCCLNRTQNLSRILGISSWSLDLDLGSVNHADPRQAVLAVPKHNRDPGHRPWDGSSSAGKRRTCGRKA